MKKILSTLSTFLFVSSIATSVFAAGDEATIKKLSSMYKSGDATQAIVIHRILNLLQMLKKTFCQILICLLGFQLVCLL